MRIIRTTPLIILSVNLIIILGLSFFVLPSLVSDFSLTLKEYMGVRAQLMGARKILNIFDSEPIVKNLVDENNFSLAVQELVRHGNARAVTIRSLNKEKIEPCIDSNCKILPLIMKIEAAYEQLGIFLGDLEKLEKSQLVVREFGIIPDKENKAKLKAKLVLDMYLSGKNEK